MMIQQPTNTEPPLLVTLLTLVVMEVVVSAQTWRVDSQWNVRRLENHIYTPTSSHTIT